MERLVIEGDLAAAAEAKCFSDWLLRIGDGAYDQVPVPQTSAVDFVDTSQLIKNVFPSLEHGAFDGSA